MKTLDIIFVLWIIGIIFYLLYHNPTRDLDYLVDPKYLDIPCERSSDCGSLPGLYCSSSERTCQHIFDTAFKCNKHSDCAQPNSVDGQVTDSDFVSKYVWCGTNNTCRVICIGDDECPSDRPTCVYYDTEGNPHRNASIDDDNIITSSCMAV